MSDDDAFLQAIREDPHDPARRLVYADWLEERGDRRAEFLRLLQQRAVVTARLTEVLSTLDPAWVRSILPDWATEVQKLPPPTELPRVETGAVQFGDDWPGLFLRGDNAISLAIWIRSLCEMLEPHPN